MTDATLESPLVPIFSNLQMSSELQTRVDPMNYMSHDRLRVDIARVKVN
jgi:hypothetical protein